MTNAPTTNGAPTAYDCGVCDGSGTVEIFDGCTGLLIDANYCVCSRGVHLRHADDFAAKRLLDSANGRLAGITLTLLERIRDGLLALPMGVRQDAPSERHGGNFEPAESQVHRVTGTRAEIITAHDGRR